MMPKKAEGSWAWGGCNRDGEKCMTQAIQEAEWLDPGLRGEGKRRIKEDAGLLGSCLEPPTDLVPPEQGVFLQALATSAPLQPTHATSLQPFLSSD